jgi:hypothetical protein
MTPRHYLIATHTDKLEYDPAAVLAFLARNPDIPLYGATTDDDRIIHVFQAVNGSTYADEHLFSSLAADEYGCELVVEDDAL